MKRNSKTNHLDSRFRKVWISKKRNDTEIKDFTNTHWRRQKVHSSVSKMNTK